MPIEIKIKISNEERLDVKVVRGPLFQAGDLRKEIFKRAGAIRLNK